MSAGLNKSLPEGPYVKYPGIWTYETNHNSDDVPIALIEPAAIGEEVGQQPADFEGLEFGNITSLALGTTEDILYFMADNN